MRVSLSADFSDLDIERAHGPLPASWRGPTGSPTGELTTRSPSSVARELSAEAGGETAGFVTLKHRDSAGGDIGRASYARSLSVGSMIGQDCSLESLDDAKASLSRVTCGGTCSRQMSSAFCREDCRSRPKGGWMALEGGESTAADSSFSAEDAAQRIAVDPDTGHSYFIERSTVCDACPYCDDVCEVAGCAGCDDRRSQLEGLYGPLVTPAAHGSQTSRIGGGCRRGGVGGSSRSSSIRSSAASSPSIGRHWGVASAEDDHEDGDSERTDSRSSIHGMASMPPPSLSARYSRKAGYTPCEVRRRKLTGACWVVCQGCVYDVTHALEDHPGGKRSVLRNSGGRDCQEDFLFHSKAAKKQWRQYRIGHLVGCDGESGTDGSRSLRMSSSECVIS